MESNNLSARIRTLEAFATANPAGYRMRVALVALLGYAYLLVIVALLLALVVGGAYYAMFNALMIKILWIPLVLAGLVVRALWITIPEPDGKELKREQAPALFELVQEVRETLKGPKVHHVLVSDEFNAAIVQIPQLGMFGWLRNYVVVGLPLMRALSSDEFRSVLAHEFGHLSGKHGSFSGWIYRIRQSWIQILTRVHEERSYAAFLFEPFLKWYAPYLNAYSFVLARAQEHEADSYSVEFAGKEVAALALVRLTTKERIIGDDFWPTFFDGAKEQSQAPRDPFTQMLSGLEQSISHSKAQRWLLDALRVPTGYDDTHPALGDRLTAIGFQKDGPELTNLMNTLVNADKTGGSAAAKYLHELPEDFEANMNWRWRERVTQGWRDRHEGFKKARKRLDELDEQSKTQQLTVEEQWERAVAVAQIEDWDAALPVVRALLNEHPDHVDANFALGSFLLGQGNKEGVSYLEKTLDAGEEIAGDACQRISGFYLEQGNHELAEAFRKRSEEHFDKAQLLREQILSFSLTDHFESHDLEEDRVAELKEQLKKIRGLEAAYLFRKLIENTPPVSLYILAFTTQPPWQDEEGGRHVIALLEELSTKLDLPSPSVMISLDGQHRHHLPLINSIAGAQLFAVDDHGVTYRH